MPTTNTWAGWFYSLYTEGQHATRTNGGPWVVSTETQDAFRVSGDLVGSDIPEGTPEPASMLLLGSGLGGLAAWRRNA